MGACASTGAFEGTEDDKRLHSEAEKALRETKATIAQQRKVLLLGAGDSGKSTILKQMRLIHKVPFSDSEREHFRQLIFLNITAGMVSVLEAIDDLGITLSEDKKDAAELIVTGHDLKDGEPFPKEFLEPLRSLWADSTVQTGYERGNEVSLPDNLPYFYGDLDRLFEPEFEPEEQDIIQCRARTIGIAEHKFKLRNQELIMVDVGGQKSERRKWIHCFQDVTCILFLTALSGFDQSLIESREENQMQDSLSIWQSITQSKWFTGTSFILFLNKDDLYAKKVATVSIKDYFPDFEGAPNDPEAGRKYFKKLFADSADKPGAPKSRTIYMHVTNATDTNLLRAVMASVEDTILRGDLAKVALL